MALRPVWNRSDRALVSLMSEVPRLLPNPEVDQASVVSSWRDSDHDGRATAHLRLRSLLACLGAILLVLGLASPARAASFHRYMRAWDNTANAYKALSVDHKDAVGQEVDTPNDGCTNFYSGTPIYQTQWIQTNDAQYWLEIGTGHQCNNTKIYRYMGYGSGGVWHPLNDFDIAGGGTHTFRIVRDDDLNHWFFYVDGDIKQAYGWSRASFPSVFTGVESYASGGFVAALHYYNLKYQGSGGNWNDWADKDGRDSDNGPMCGKWASATSFEAGQATTC